MILQLTQGRLGARFSTKVSVMSNDQSRWGLVLLLSATATAGYICRVNVSTAGILIMKEFGLDQAAMGRVFGSFLLGYALAQVPAGLLADHLGTRRTLAIAAWVWAAVTAVQTLIGLEPLPLASASVLSALLAARFVLGIAEAPTYPASARGVSRWVAPPFQARANGLVIASIGLGSAIASPLVSISMLHWGWRAAILISAVPALGAALLWLRTAEPREFAITDGNTPTEHVPLTKAGAPGLWSTRFALLTASYTLQGYVGYIFVFWFYLYLVQERHFSMLGGAWINSLSWILSIVSIPLGGLISDRLAAGPLSRSWGSRIVPMAGMAISGLLISIGARTNSPMAAACALALATAFVLSVEGPFWTAMTRIAGPRSGTAGGIMNFGCNLGGLISPVLTPLLASYIGWENALYLAGGLAVLSAALWLGIRPDRIQAP